MKKLICILFSIFALCTLLGGCALFEGKITNVRVIADVKYESGIVENCGEWQYPVKGFPYTVKASDTEDYEFWYWEKDGKNVSEKKLYTFIAEEETRLLAVFKPKAEDKVLINTTLLTTFWQKPQNWKCYILTPLYSKIW